MIGCLCASAPEPSRNATWNDSCVLARRGSGIWSSVAKTKGDQSVEKYLHAGKWTA